MGVGLSHGLQYLFEQAECTAMTHSTDRRGFALAIANPRPSPKLTISFLPQLKAIRVIPS